jgi:ankyrin repeat protein
MYIENFNNQNILTQASYKAKDLNNIRIVNFLLENGVDVNKQDNYGNTALMLASNYSNKYSNNETVKLLLQYEADANIQNDDGNTALILASCYSNNYSNNETIKILLKYGADINIQNNEGFTALNHACLYSNTCSNNNTVKLLIENGADLENISDNENTILMSVTSNLMGKDNLKFINTTYLDKEKSNIDTLKILIKSGVEINKKDDFGYTALLYTSLFCDNDKDIMIAKLLLDNRADIDLKENGDQWYLNLVICTLGYKSEIVKILLDSRKINYLNFKDYDICFNYFF